MLFMSIVLFVKLKPKNMNYFPSELLYGDEKVTDEKKKKQVSIMEQPEERTYDPTDS